MIAVEQATCKICGDPLPQSTTRRGHRKREYCSGRCRQIAHRQQTSDVTNDVTIEDDKQQRIAELEARVKDLEAMQARRTSKVDKMGHKHLQERVLAYGAKLGYKRLELRLSTGQGPDAWRTFVKQANDELLALAINAASQS